MQFSVDMLIFTKEIPNGKLNFVCSECIHPIAQRVCPCIEKHLQPPISALLNYDH